MRIALYGKGGIGKSTVASNVSTLLSRKGKVLQIGCDPKHDSTLMLLDGPVNTVLEGLNSVNSIGIEDVRKTSKYGIDCIEIGGPEPGVGCAGRGIVKGLEIIKRLDVYATQYDYILYDILGDVVCGGFFEPLKNGSVDAMYIVTSGEFNSLFAANNLCKGYLNCKLRQKGVRFGGIIANCRGIDREEELIRAYCEMIDAPLVSVIPRDYRIERSTFEGIPVAVLYDREDVVKPFEKIVDEITSQQQGGEEPKPLTLEQLRDLCKKTRFQ